MHDHGLPQLRQTQQQLQLSSYNCSTEGQHLVAVGAHWIDRHYMGALH